MIHTGSSAEGGAQKDFGAQVNPLTYLHFSDAGNSGTTYCPSAV